MTTINPSSAISIMCDCPYTGLTREVTVDPESDARKRKELQRQIKSTKEDLIVARTVLMNDHYKLATFKRLLSLELGCIINPYIRPRTTWKDRVREESYLKSELIHLIDYLRQCDIKYGEDPAAHPTKLSASTEDLLYLAQEKTLKKLYHDRTFYHSEMEKETGKCLWEFMELKENYENKLYHNKVLEREISDVKKKIVELQRQFLEDKCLIDYITEHHFQMKGCFLEVFPKSSESAESSRKEKILDSEAEKFKNLWEQSKGEKQKALTSVQALSKRLDFANKKIIRAENACVGNIIAFKMLTRMIKDGTLFSKLQPKRPDEFGKFSAVQFRNQSRQLEAAKNENNYLRKFLKKAVLSKKEDLERFQHSLQSTAQKYRTILEAVRNSTNAAASK